MGQESTGINYLGDGELGNLQFACQQGNLEVVKLLLQHKDIDVNQHQPGRESCLTPLWFACREGHTKVVSWLIVQENLDLNWTNEINAGWANPLGAAIGQGHRQTAMALLVDRRILDKHCNQKVHEEYAALDWIVTMCDEEQWSVVAQLLLKSKNINVNSSVDNHEGGLEPLLLNVIRQSKYRFAFKLIKHARIDLSVKTPKGESALDLLMENKGLLMKGSKNYGGEKSLIQALINLIKEKEAKR